MKNIKTHIPAIIASLILFASVPMLYAWTGPTVAPTGGNVAAPINVSKNDQNKLGALGLGGLAVFGKSLFTESKDYILPASKPTMLLGVNGAIGAREYCDQNGNNCVTTLGGTPSNTTVNTSSSGGQILPGWPNGIVCNATTGRKYILPVVGYFPKGQERYSNKPGYIYGQIGGLISIFFDATTKKSLIVHGNGEYMSGGQIPKEYAPCFDLGKSITDPAFTWI